jgi:phosphatidylserine/phosphatidylglycerophosphate/cardiolipin synthase-like enzyme
LVSDIESYASLLRKLSNSWFPAQVEVFFDGASLVMTEETIAGSQHSIDMEMFMIGGDYGERILRMLDSKAREGVKVRLIHREGTSIRCGVALKRLGQYVTRSRNMDASHHYRPTVDRLFLNELKHSPIRRGHFPLHRFGHSLSAPLKLAHDKLIIVDGQCAIMGGMNLADAVAENHDLFVKITGHAVAAPSIAFEYDWSLTHPGKSGPNRTVFPPTSETGNTSDVLRFLTTRPHSRDQLDDVIGIIAAAKKRIWIEMFYVTEHRIIRALIRAIRRNVDVRVICDPNEYSLGLPMRGAPNLPFVGELAGGGVPIRLFDTAPGKQMHQKSMLLDDEFVYTGATNFTRMSFRANTESSVLIRSRSVAKIFEKRFLDDWRNFSKEPDHDLIRRRRSYLGIVRRLSRYI